MRLRPHYREDLSEVQAWMRCAKRRNSQVAAVLVIGLISMSLFMPNSRERLGSTTESRSQMGEDTHGWRTSSMRLSPEGSLRRPLYGIRGGADSGRARVYDNIRHGPGRVYAYRGGATGIAGGANDSAAAARGTRGAAGRGRGGKPLFLNHFCFSTQNTTPSGAKG
mmetsp:Transcript_8818/g.17266  ORF Transcript_8818/g.17266 Transcript_8818/m.17266 type:complete len:166 (-) Transcript_8818:184-681(-)